MATPQLYKYRLKEIKIKQYGANSRGLSKELSEYLGITPKTIGMHMNIRKNEEREISHALLVLYAQFFKVELNEILNTKND